MQTHSTRMGRDIPQALLFFALTLCCDNPTRLDCLQLKLLSASLFCGHTTLNISTLQPDNTLLWSEFWIVVTLLFHFVGSRVEQLWIKYNTTDWVINKEYLLTCFNLQHLPFKFDFHAFAAWELSGLKSANKWKLSLRLLSIKICIFIIIWHVLGFAFVQLSFFTFRSWTPRHSVFSIAPDSLAMRMENHSKDSCLPLNFYFWFAILFLTSFLLLGN